MYADVFNEIREFILIVTVELVAFYAVDCSDYNYRLLLRDSLNDCCKYQVYADRNSICIENYNFRTNLFNLKLIYDESFFASSTQ